MPDPTKFNLPCNCYGAMSRFEMEQEFHEMGIEGCVRDLAKYAKPPHPLQKFVDWAKDAADNYEPSAYLKNVSKE